MSASEVFEWVANELEGRTPLDRSEARDTIRLALQEVGLEAESVTVAQMTLVLARVMPKALEGRGIADGADAICEQLLEGLPREGEGRAPESAYEVFRRLGRDEESRE